MDMEVCTNDLLFVLAFYYANYLGTGSLSEEFYEKMVAILNMAVISCVDKKHHVQQNVHSTVVLSSKFCTDIIFSLENMKLFVSFFHITAVKRCQSKIVLNTNCTPTFMDS
jgi:hypothetical protein